VLDSSVSGSCDPADMAGLQKTYGSMSTAGSPDSQPINVLAMPRIGPFPISFAPPAQPKNGGDGLSAGDKPIWTLTVTGRHP